MRMPTVFVNSGGPEKTLDGRAILVLCGKGLQVLVWPTCTAKVARRPFKEERKVKASGVRLDALTRKAVLGRTPWVRLHGYTQLKNANRCFPASRAARNKRYAQTRSFGFNGEVRLWNSKSRMGGQKKKHQKRHHKFHVAEFMTQSGVMITHLW